ncbi:unnamed protein product [Symbiodinium natans]|uniref:Uncharacterized protein n=1 Tax=Symbiodinium natans TaxID=878477 RepID=A0A812L724_9DINO|nr:unnamed protein product [Symbiodinium natans]CAE7560830.1 unnamed protein product [Symbiodinium natans]
MDAVTFPKVRAAFENFLNFLEHDNAQKERYGSSCELHAKKLTIPSPDLERSRSRSRTRQGSTSSTSPLSSPTKELQHQQPSASLDEPLPHDNPDSMRKGIISLIRLFKGQDISDEEATREALAALGAPSDSTLPLCKVSPQAGPGAVDKLMLAFTSKQTEQARAAIHDLRQAIKAVDTSTGARTIQISFRRPVDPIEVAERVEFWKGETGPKIPVEPLEIRRHGSWKKPVGPQSYATAGGDARKFVLRLQIASGAKVKKLSLQVKVASKELLVLGAKTILTEEAPSMVMHFGPHADVQILAGAVQKFDVSQFFGASGA